MPCVDMCNIEVMPRFRGSRSEKHLMMSKLCPGSDRHLRRDQHVAALRHKSLHHGRKGSVSHRSLFVPVHASGERDHAGTDLGLRVADVGWHEWQPLSGYRDNDALSTKWSTAEQPRRFCDMCTWACAYQDLGMFLGTRHGLCGHASKRTKGPTARSMLPRHAVGDAEMVFRLVDLLCTVTCPNVIGINSVIAKSGTRSLADFRLRSTLPLVGTRR
jgi:hypothetical protein